MGNDRNTDNLRNKLPPLPQIRRQNKIAEYDQWQQQTDGNIPAYDGSPNKLYTLSQTIERDL